MSHRIMVIGHSRHMIREVEFSLPKPETTALLVEAIKAQGLKTVDTADSLTYALCQLTDAMGKAQSSLERFGTLMLHALPEETRPDICLPHRTLKPGSKGGARRGQRRGHHKWE